MHHRSAVPKICVTPGFWLILACALLVLPLRWLASWAIALAVHEIFHYIALRFCHYHPYEISFTANGIFMKTPNMRWSDDVLCAAAGPAGSAILTLLHRSFPELALVSGLQCIFNILPIYPLDGGRALRAVIEKLGSLLFADKCMNILKYGMLTFITCISIYAVIILRVGFIPIIICLLLWLRSKFSCKAGRL